MTQSINFERRDEIVSAIKSFYQQHGYQPTVRELCEITGLESTSTVHHYLTALRKAGRVDWVDGQVRTLHLVEAVAA